MDSSKSLRGREENQGNVPVQSLYAKKGSKVLLNSSVRRLLSILTLVVMDLLALVTGLELAGYLVGGISRMVEVTYFAPGLLAVWLAVFAAHNLYGRAPSRRKPGALLGAVLWGTLLLLIGRIIYPQLGFSLEEIVLEIFFVLLLSVGLRLLYEQGTEIIYQRGVGRVPTLVIGEKEERERVRRVMDKSTSAYNCVGELHMNGGGVDLPLVRQMLDRTEARCLILAGGGRLSDVQSLDFMRSMWLRRVRVMVIPDTIALMGSNLVISQDVGVPLLEVGYPRLNSVQWALKRVLDLAGSLGGLVILSPLLLAVAVLIKLTSPGPALFKQKRVGADEKTFFCYKFRSMYNDAEARQAEFESRNEADGGVVFKIKSDPRITSVGYFIRRWSIDELPQLINVLKGEMSLVGPRPLPLRDFKLMSELHKKRLATIPGLTGYWQISGRSNLTFEDMVRLDLYYIEQWSLSLDIKIILKTLKVVLQRKGAY